MTEPQNRPTIDPVLLRGLTQSRFGRRDVFRLFGGVAGAAALAATGSDVAPYAFGGAGLVLLGTLLLVVRATMHRQARQTRRSTP